MALEDESPEVKLAVDLIMLLESNDVEPELVLAALEIVKKDYQRKHRRDEDKPSC
ncbi:pleiotropic regulatory protein RsmS [Sodalis sp. dw_96]|uniref:pleiotropic regulatory protein RsmS n=1 Tax=Sodalis sp. dw_96 TaxID=2719794 RepID=UPI001BD55C28